MIPQMSPTGFSESEMRSEMSGETNELWLKNPTQDIFIAHFTAGFTGSFPLRFLSKRAPLSFVPRDVMERISFRASFPHLPLN